MAYTGDSIVDYLKSTGQDSSFSARKTLAESLGITNYTGSGPQNTQMLNTLKNNGNTASTNDAKTTPSGATNDDIIFGKKEEAKEEGKKNNPPLGVSDDLWAKKDETFKASKDSNKADKESNNALSNLKDLTSKEDIISDDVMNSINQQFNVPSAVIEADAYLAEQLDKIQSGKTSYSDQVKEMLDKIMNREKFSYDVDTDPLFQQALASAMNSGKQAMQDTIGQASALTGGYGSSYATTAGNQAYNAFIEDAYDNLPQYYQLALEAYQMEGEEMYRQFGMVSELDDKEFSRNVTAYDATSQYRNRVYDEAYNMYRDSVNDAFAMANLQLNEHGQRVNDAYNYYSASSDYSDKLYEREYTEWADSINMAWKEIEALNTDAWASKNYDESVRQYETSLAENKRQFDTSLEENKRQFDTSLEENKRQFNETMAFNQAKAASSGGGGGGGGSRSSKTSELKSPTETQMKNALKAYNESGNEGFNKYVNSIPDTVDKDAIVQYIAQYGELPYSQRTYTVIDDGGTNWGWGIDNNAKVKDQYGNEFTLKQLKNYDEDIAKELSKKEYKKGSTYTKK